MAPLVVESLNSLREFVGKEIGAGDWFAVSQDRINKFAEVTEDHQWIHIDSERAKRESPFGGTIAHGFLTLSLISSFMKQVLQIANGFRLVVNYGLNRVRFPSPVRAGAKVRARFTLAALKHLPDGHEAIFSVVVESEGGSKPCCVAEWVLRYYR